MPIIKGLLKSRSEVGFTMNDKKKRTFILDCSGENSKNFLEFTLYGEAVRDISNYRLKEEIYVSYNPRGFISDNKGKERLNQSLICFFIENEYERDVRKTAEGIFKKSKKK